MAAATHAFGIKMRFILGDTGIRERTDQSTGRATDDRPARCASQCGGQPTGRHDGSDAGDCHDAKTGQKSAGSAHGGAQPGSDTGAGGGITVVLAVGYDADVIGRNAHGFKVVDGLTGSRTVVKQCVNRSHGKSPQAYWLALVVMLP